MRYLTIRQQITHEGAESPAQAAPGEPARALSGESGFTDTRIVLDPAGDPAVAKTLAQVIYLSGLVAPPALCSGLGRCGRCRARFLSDPPPALAVERNVLSDHDIEGGWRLACRHAASSNMHVLLPPPSLYAGRESGLKTAQGKVEQWSADQAQGVALGSALGTAADPAAGLPVSQTAGLPRGAALRLAVDLGTTSLHWRAGESGGVMINPQMGAGSDVMSRLAYAADAAGAAALQRLTLDALRRICAGLDGCQPGSGPVTEICLAANPAMTAIALGKDVTGLSRAPYRLDYAGGVTEHLPGLPPVYVPPQVSPFIGGDISAGYAALMFYPPHDRVLPGAMPKDRALPRPMREDPALPVPAPEFPFLLTDLGTNGECLLALSPTQALAASVPMGPALEGINLTFGTEARPGAVTAYALTPLGLEPQVMGRAAPKGITATGYLSLLQGLRKAGLIGVDGLFVPAGCGSSLAKRFGAAETGLAGEARLRLPGRMFLAASDVEEILKVKAAFSLAVSRLLAAAGLSASRLTGLFLAGALGAHAPLDALEGLGFIPPGFGGKVRAVGNTSLAGAQLFLDHPQTREQCAAWASNVTTLELAGDPAFAAAYANHMVFAWQ